MTDTTTNEVVSDKYDGCALTVCSQQKIEK